MFCKFWQICQHLIILHMCNYVWNIDKMLTNGLCVFLAHVNRIMHLLVVNVCRSLALSYNNDVCWNFSDAICFTGKSRAGDWGRQDPYLRRNCRLRRAGAFRQGQVMESNSEDSLSDISGPWGMWSDVCCDFSNLIFRCHFIRQIPAKFGRLKYFSKATFVNS